MIENERGPWTNVGKLLGAQVTLRTLVELPYDRLGAALGEVLKDLERCGLPRPIDVGEMRTCRAACDASARRSGAGARPASLVSEVRGLERLALEDAEPLFDLV